MSHSNQIRQPRKPPLGDATIRVNNARDTYSPSPDKHAVSMPHHESLKPGGQLPTSDAAPNSPAHLSHGHSSHDHSSHVASTGSNIPNPRLSAISKEGQTSNSNRNSQISTTSTNASDGRRRKTHIGPWQLGKTLGKGATARVRMARHSITGQPAAIKIVQKKNAQLSQAGSLASLDRRDGAFIDHNDGFRRMPYGIEREVAIMKLIEHPHIMKLYDIWENRTEIYLVLEYVDNGELFEHISREGRLREEEALKYFRQLLSAVGYCHQFNICHRDLKPENILLTKEGDVKIADFGMAALQQTPEHRLQTSCGSPHYAAPEVIKAIPYRGDKVDIWSMGVILYAALSGRLPFDNPTLPGLLAMIQKGQYRMASCIGPEAADLIHRMLQINARDRLSINQIWRHPLLRKYDYLDDYGGGINPRLPDIRDCGRPVLRKSDIDRELLRHLRSMWHHFEESQLIKLLLNDQPNDQKLFYSLLLKHRDTQLENYIPDISYSNSDYHHARPLAQVKKLSSRQFTQSSMKGHGRQVSRFTVISNISKGQHSRKNSEYAETETTGTVHSYDPFKGSRPRNLIETGTAKASIVVHRKSHGEETFSKAIARHLDVKPNSQETSHESISYSTAGQVKQQNLPPPRLYASRSSLASSTRSRSNATVVRPATAYKRGISFSHIRKSSTPKQRMVSDSQVIARHNTSIKAETSENVTKPRASTTSPSASQLHIDSGQGSFSTSQQRLELNQPERASHFWREDVRKLSNSLAKDCDEAFNRASVASSNPTQGTQFTGVEEGHASAYETPLSSFDCGSALLASSPIVPSRPQKHAFAAKTDHFSWDSRPLPAPPTRSESIDVELAEARRQAELRKSTGSTETSPTYLDRMVSHIDRLMQPTSSTVHPNGDRRTTSAPTYIKASEDGRHLPSIYEFDGEEVSPLRSSKYENVDQHGYVAETPVSRNASDPDPHISKQRRRSDYHQHLLRQDPSHDMPSSPSPAKPPAPLNIRKKGSQGAQSIMPPMMTGALGGGSGRAHQSDLRQQYSQYPFVDNSTNPETVDQENHVGTNHSLERQDVIGARKKANWFTRHTRSSEEGSIQHGQEVGNSLPLSHKKSFGLGRLFKKRALKHEGETAVAAFEIFDEEGSAAASIVDHQRHDIQAAPAKDVHSLTTRQIEPQQNWLARLFHVKPAMRLICFSVSKRRARQEIVTLLKEWRKYGTKDIVVDKDRNIVFGKVGAKNYLQMKEVAFASEIMTVVEHGRRSHLSIARFTQEKGAASSFYKLMIEKKEFVAAVAKIEEMKRVIATEVERKRRERWEKMERQEARVRELKAKRSREGRWKSDELGWNIVQEGELSPILQSLEGSLTSAVRPDDRLYAMRIPKDKSVERTNESSRNLGVKPSKLPKPYRTPYVESVSTASRSPDLDHQRIQKQHKLRSSRIPIFSPGDTELETIRSVTGPTGPFRVPRKPVGLAGQQRETSTETILHHETINQLQTADVLEIPQQQPSSTILPPQIKVTSPANETHTLLYQTPDHFLERSLHPGTGHGFRGKNAIAISSHSTMTRPSLNHCPSFPSRSGTEPTVYVTCLSELPQVRLKKPEDAKVPWSRPQPLKATGMEMDDDWSLVHQRRPDHPVCTTIPITTIPIITTTGFIHPLLLSGQLDGQDDISYQQKETRSASLKGLSHLTTAGIGISSAQIAARTAFLRLDRQRSGSQLSEIHCHRLIPKTMSKESESSHLFDNPGKGGDTGDRSGTNQTTLSHLGFPQPWPLPPMHDKKNSSGVETRGGNMDDPTTISRMKANAPSSNRDQFTAEVTNKEKESSPIPLTVSKSVVTIEQEASKQPRSEFRGRAWLEQLACSSVLIVELGIVSGIGLLMLVILGISYGAAWLRKLRQ